MRDRPQPLMAIAALAALLAGCAAPPRPVQVNTLGMAFVRIPAGEFTMGSDEPADSLALAFPVHERERLESFSDEAPAHRVRITQTFLLGQHEVTVGQFRRFLERSGYVVESIADGTGGYSYDPLHDSSTTSNRDSFAGRDPRYSWRDPGFPQSEDHPVVNVTWNDAMAMARWLSVTEGRRYRLPTEAEWEYACRAGSRTRYHTGDAPQSLVGAANLFDARAAALWPEWNAVALQADDGYTFTAPVGSYPPNAFGLYDMHGNAWEWTSDWYLEDWYANSPTDDPRGPAQGEVRVRRGGSWHTWPLYARCSFRNWVTPQSRYTLIGFRLLLEAD